MAATPGGDTLAAAQLLFGHAHWTSVLPPVLAILMALLSRQVILSLFAGIWLGVFFLTSPGIAAVPSSFLAVLTDAVVPAAADPDHLSIIVFSMLIGGMIAIITENGGTRGVIRVLTRFARTRIHGQVASFGMGVAVFFDDYATTMVVGNTMRPLTDRLRISRAKLAYLVDSTAAPVAVIALVSTWIGAMVAFIGDSTAGLTGFDRAPYAVFLESMAFNFYSSFAIVFALAVAWSGRDFGPMLRSEARVRAGTADRGPSAGGDAGGHDREHRVERVSHWANAAVPILVLVTGTVVGLLVTGEGTTIQDIVATADSYAALLWGSLLSVTVAMIMTVSQRLLPLDATMEALMRGMYVMFGGLLILVLAWALSALARELGTAEFLVGLFGQVLDPAWMPAILFVLAGSTAFATGSSWGTMGILMPLALPLVWVLGLELNLAAGAMQQLVSSAVGAVVAGSVMGDHASPISDTTILSSLAAQCDHVEHVNTQLPYAAACAGLTLAGLIATALAGLPWWLVHLLGFAAIVAIVTQLGRAPVARRDEEAGTARRTQPFTPGGHP
jgi:Na+/H+ antiporter NhaC